MLMVKTCQESQSLSSASFRKTSGIYEGQNAVGKSNHKLIDTRFGHSTQVLEGQLIKVLACALHPEAVINSGAQGKLRLLFQGTQKSLINMHVRCL